MSPWPHLRRRRFRWAAPAAPERLDVCHLTGLPNPSTRYNNAASRDGVPGWKSPHTCLGRVKTVFACWHSRFLRYNTRFVPRRLFSNPAPLVSLVFFGVRSVAAWRVSFCAHLEIAKTVQPYTMPWCTQIQRVSVYVYSPLTSAVLENTYQTHSMVVRLLRPRALGCCVELLLDPIHTTGHLPDKVPGCAEGVHHPGTRAPGRPVQHG